MQQQKKTTKETTEFLKHTYALPWFLRDVTFRYGPMEAIRRHGVKLEKWLDKNFPEKHDMAQIGGNSSDWLQTFKEAGGGGWPK